jgi:hypothetical protein
MSAPPKPEAGQIIGHDRTPGYWNTPIPVRAADPEMVMYAMDLISAGELTEEEAMRILYPEETGRMFNLDHDRTR